MEIIIDNIKQFKPFFDVIYDVASDLLELQLFPERMVCTVLGRGKTTFFHVEYKSDFFDVYDVNGVESITIFADDFVKLLKLTNDKDTLYLELNDPYLVAKIESPTGNTRVFEFVLPTDFIDSPAPPHIDLDAIVECGVGDLKQSIEDINLIGSDLYTLVANGKESLTIMTDSAISTKYANNINVEYLKESDTVKSSFALEYINQLIKFRKVNETVTLKIGQDMPLFYTFKDELMGVTVNGMIAPLLSEED